MKLKIGFAGARWLGVNCLKILSQQKNISIANVCFPTKEVPVWWRDVIDEDEIKKLGFKITPWADWKSLDFDLVFSVLHGRIFKPVHLQNAKLGIINLHPAPLPRYRGCNSYSHAIINGEKKYGVSLHYVDVGIDTGDIIGVNYFPIQDSDTAFSLYERSQKEALILFEQKITSILDFAQKGMRFPARKQNDASARYYPRTSLDNKKISLNWPKVKIERFVRGLDFPPFEPAYILVNKKKLYLTYSNTQTSGS